VRCAKISIKNIKQFLGLLIIIDLKLVSGEKIQLNTNKSSLHPSSNRNKGELNKIVLGLLGAAKIIIRNLE
jgi:hypothetical protein